MAWDRDQLTYSSRFSVDNFSACILDSLRQLGQLNLSESDGRFGLQGRESQRQLAVLFPTL